MTTADHDCPEAPTVELRAIVEEAYRLFAPYTVGSSLHVCNCNICMSKEDERRLARAPVREIPAVLLAEYTNSAHDWDDHDVAREMRHFLPRYLDLIAHGEAPDHMGLDICLRRLAFADWRGKWPAGERDLLDCYFGGLVRSSVRNLRIINWKQGPALAYDFGAVLTMLVTAGADIEAALAAWDAAADPPAVVHMAALRARVRTKRSRSFFDSAFLEGEHAAAAERIAAFLGRPEIDARIEGAFFALDDARLQSILSDAMRA